MVVYIVAPEDVWEMIGGVKVRFGQARVRRSCVTTITALVHIAISVH